MVVPFADVSQSQANDLVAAAEKGSMAEVESMLHLPQDPDLFGSDGSAALMYAAGAGHVEIVRLLLLLKADTGRGAAQRVRRSLVGASLQCTHAAQVMSRWSA